jgi:hypothetical protein
VRVGTMRKTAFVVVSIGTIACATVAPAKGPYGSIQIGNWQGGAYTNDATGEFNGCTAGAAYQSGIYFAVSVSAKMTWSLGFGHPSWRLTPREAFPIDLVFDGQQQFHVFGNPITNQLVSVPMPDNSTLINAFRKSRTMLAFAKGQQFTFNLASTSALLPVLVNCVQRINANGLTSAGDFSIPATSHREHQVPVASNAGSSLKPETNEPQSAELQVEAVELASNFLMRTQLHNPKIVSRPETPVELASYGAAWKSEEASGFVRIVPTGPDVKGLDVAATVVGNDAKACKGKFASARMSELVDSDVVFRGVATCEDSDGTRVAEYFIVPRRKDGFVMFSVQSNSKIAQEGDVTRGDVTRDENLAGFRKAALVAVSQ